MNIKPMSGMFSRDIRSRRRLISYSASQMATADLVAKSKARPATTAVLTKSAVERDSPDEDGSSLVQDKVVVVNVSGSKYPVGELARVNFGCCICFCWLLLCLLFCFFSPPNELFGGIVKFNRAVASL